MAPPPSMAGARLSLDRWYAVIRSNDRNTKELSLHSVKAMSAAGRYSVDGQPLDFSERPAMLFDVCDRIKGYVVL